MPGEMVPFCRTFWASCRKNRSFHYVCLAIALTKARPGDCEDSEALVPFVPLDKRLKARLNTINATGGTTLITHSLRQTLVDFGDVEGWKLIVLVTDGEEECEPDIAAVLREA